MKCPLETRDREILLAYSSHKLDAGEILSLDSHLENCAGCRDFVRAQRAICDALEAWEAPPVSADFDRRLSRRMDHQVSWLDRMMQPFQAFGFRQLVPIAASAGVVLMAGLLLERTAVTPQAPQHDTAQMETLQPEQLELALDEMEALSQLSRPVHTDNADSKM